MFIYVLYSSYVHTKPYFFSWISFTTASYNFYLYSIYNIHIPYTFWSFHNFTLVATNRLKKKKKLLFILYLLIYFTQTKFLWYTRKLKKLHYFHSIKLSYRFFLDRCTLRRYRIVGFSQFCAVGIWTKHYFYPETCTIIKLYYCNNILYKYAVLWSIMKFLDFKTNYSGYFFRLENL